MQPIAKACALKGESHVVSAALKNEYAAQKLTIESLTKESVLLTKQLKPLPQAIEKLKKHLSPSQNHVSNHRHFSRFTHQTLVEQKNFTTKKIQSHY